MNDYHERLAKLLLEKNNQLSSHQALTWVELLWEDFESTSAKAGRDYLGSDMTERIVTQWIQNYGDKLHEFVAKNPKYKDYLNQDKNTLN
nr:YfhJ family protein [Neobacillus sp. Marseille-Q6967]